MPMITGFRLAVVVNLSKYRRKKIIVFQLFM